MAVTCWRVIAASIMCLVVLGTASAQTIVPTYAGQCAIQVDVPPQPSATTVTIWLNGHVRTRPVPASASAQIVTCPLQQPLKAGDVLRTGFAGAVGPTAYQVPHAPAGATPACAARTADTRESFEATGFVGAVFDQFGPKEGGPARTTGTDGGQVDTIDGVPVEGEVPTEIKPTAGVEAEARLGGDPDDTVQVWLSSFLLYSFRTQDTAADTLEGAFGNPGRQFLTTLHRATTLEAHFAPRIELWTLQPTARTPIKIFLGGQFGFVGFAGGSKVFETDQVGLGLLIPSGPFRKTSAMFGLGRTDYLRSHQGWNRYKVRAMLAFDVLPNLKERFKSLGFGSWRGFVCVSIDRNPNGPGPETVHTYVGLVFDFRRAFRP